MSKKRIKRILKLLEPLNPWYLLVLALVFSAVAIYGLRQNNLTMVRLREEVFTQDKQNGDVEKSLKDLRQFMYAHMNTNLNTGTGVKPPIQLKYTYERLVQKEANRTKSTNEDIYTQAQRVCEKRYPQSFSGGPRVPCIRDYVSKHSVKEQSIPDALYKFDFVSPAWTPDLAGWTLVASGLLFILFVLRVILDIWLKHELHDTL